eukprot:6508770-Pyramimonas_sp.AAC.1
MALPEVAIGEYCTGSQSDAIRPFVRCSAPITTRGINTPTGTPVGMVYTRPRAQMAAGSTGPSELAYEVGWAHALHLRPSFF